tara:strand:+ start:251 stop:511 length:261 start_codon:yes stop_codon:yes gene_type:complete
MEGLDFGIVEIILMGIMAVLGYLWKSQASEVRRTAIDLNKLALRFAEAKGSAEATNRTLFAHIEEMKDAIARIEGHLISKGGRNVE